MYYLLHTISPQLRTPPSLGTFWMVLVFLLALSLVAYARVAYTKRLQRLVSSALRLQIMRQTMREELVFSHRATLLLFGNYLLVGGIVLYALCQYLHFNPLGLGGLSLFLFLTAILLALFVLRMMISGLLSWLYRDSGMLREFQFMVLLSHLTTGILLLLPAMGLVFSTRSSFGPLLLTCGIVVGAGVLYRTARGLVAAGDYPVSQVYIILYLCTLEILPYLLLYKAMQEVII